MVKRSRFFSPAKRRSQGFLAGTVAKLQSPACYRAADEIIRSLAVIANE